MSLCVSLGVLGAVLALAVVFRLPLAETGLRWWLASHGVMKPELSVVGLNGSGIEIADIRAGTDAAVRIRRVVVDFSPASLIEFRAERVSIIGSRIRAELADGSARVAGLPDMAPGAGPADGPLVLPVDRVTLDDARIDVRTPFGPLAVTASGHLDAPPGDRIDGRLTLDAAGAPGRISAVLSASGPALDRFAATLDVTDGMVRTPELAVAALTGSGSFSLSDGAPEGAELSLAATGVELPGVAGGLRGKLDVTAVWRDRTGALDAAFREADGGHGLTVEAATTAISVDAAEASATLLARIGMDRLTIGDAAARSLSVVLPLRLRRTPRDAEIALDGDARFSAQSIAASRDLRTAAPVRVTLPASSPPLAMIRFDESGAITSIAHAVNAIVDATRYTLPAGPSTPRNLDLAEMRFNYAGTFEPPVGYSGSGTLAAGSGELSDPAVSLQRLEADFKLKGFAPVDGTLRVDVSRVVDRAAPQRFAPIGLTVETQRESGETRFTVALNDVTRTTRAIASGRWPLSGPRDEIFIEIPPIVFARGSLQPGTLFPLLAPLDATEGRLSGIARLRRAGGSFDATAELFFEDFSVIGKNQRLSGLSALISLDSLVPPTTPPGQVLTIDRLDMLTPLDDIRVVYRLADQGGVPRLDIASARASLLGGTIALAEAALMLDGAPSALPVVVHALDVAQLLSLVGVDGLEGTGTLSGAIPITVSAAGIAVHDARLAADGPGRLKLDAAEAAAFLAAQGESVDMALRALEDFRYSELTLAIGKETTGEARMALSMLGMNPAVLDGHPFRFNVNLKSNIDELIAALMLGYRIVTVRN